MNSLLKWINLSTHSSYYSRVKPDDSMITFDS
jgi:hypothetical protein